MKSSELAAKLEALNPSSTPKEVARMCTTLTSILDESSALYDEHQFEKICDEVNLRLSFASDQQAAVVQELEQLTNSAPEDFTPDQIWILVRAIKVQSQMLSFYTGSRPVSELN